MKDLRNSDAIRKEIRILGYAVETVKAAAPNPEKWFYDERTNHAVYYLSSQIGELSSVLRSRK